MRVEPTIEGIRQAVAPWQCAPGRLGFVPTMGNLHQGHLALVEKAQASCERVVVSIFVNPMQFDRASDLQAYPRTLEQDLALLREKGVDAVFTPSPEVLYPHGLDTLTRVEVPGISSMLEGAARPGHFTGVSTVVCKLLNIVRPDVAVFGEKDFQQLLLIRKMVSDLDMPVEILALPTVRESDGLALSSRNGYLTPEERVIAPRLHTLLQSVAADLKADTGDAHEAILRQGMAELESQGFRPEYLELRRASDLQEAAADDKTLRLLVAAWLGKARLIDNIAVDLG